MDKKPGYQNLIQDISHKSLIIGIFGIRGSGKTSKGYNILDICHSGGRPTYILRFPKNKTRSLPSYIKSIDRVEDAPEGGCILIDEASLYFYSKESMSQTSKLLSRMMITARHRDQTLIFTTVTATSIDVDIIRLLDVILYCKPSKFSEMFEREKLRWVAEKARREFENIEGDFRGYAFVWSEYWEGLIEWKLPDYWSEELSKYLGDYQIRKQEEPSKIEKPMKLKLSKRYLHVLKAVSKGYDKPKLIEEYYNINRKSVSKILKEMGDLGLVVKPHFWSGYKTTEKALDFIDLRSAPRGKRKK